MSRLTSSVVDAGDTQRAGFKLRDFRRVDFEGSTGWVQKNTINTTQHVVVRANKGTDNTINVRSEPSRKAGVVAQAKYGVVFKKLAKKGDWVQVEHGEGVTGWIESSLLWGF